MDPCGRSFLHVLRGRSFYLRRIAAGSAFEVVAEAVAAGIAAAVDFPAVVAGGSAMVDWKLDDSVDFRWSPMLSLGSDPQHSFLPLRRPYWHHRNDAHYYRLVSKGSVVAFRGYCHHGAVHPCFPAC